MSHPNRQPQFWKRETEKRAAREQKDGQNRTSSANNSPPPPNASSQPVPVETTKKVNFGTKLSVAPTSNAMVVPREVQKITVDKRTPYERTPFPAPKPFAMECSVFATISFIDKEGIVHIWPTTMTSNFVKWNKQWQVEFPKLPSLDPARLKHGDPCVVKYWKDGKWYRATYLGLRNDKRHSFFEDYGTVEPVADTDFKEADPEGKIGYEIPCELYSCNLARWNLPQKYFVLDGHGAVVEQFLAVATPKSRFEFVCDFDIFAYRRHYVYGRARTLLVVGMTTLDGLNFEHALLKAHPDITEVELHVPPTTFTSDPDERACVPLTFALPYPPPLSERILVQVRQFFPTEAFLVVSYFPVPRGEWSHASPAARLIYGDASILQSCEKSWTEGEASLLPTKAITLGNTYLMEHEGKIGRIEVKEYLELDDHTVPTRASVSLIDMGVDVAVECSKILDFPRTIVAEPPLQAFSVTVDFHHSGNTESTRKENSKDKRQFVDSAKKLTALVGRVVEMETFQRTPGENDLVRVYA
ncbi:hypothetical protein RvY_18617-2 [Ramazzottius varieornatus]|uniref:Tudor domain-containing protein n=1 Tax=Ramazzottius varieornatus TaxID=947166 RepID=A0A1D1W9K3_RAMVA|nr:hypothetical protein RvY_18617-2 [Ramazzottius varieornatus]